MLQKSNKILLVLVFIFIIFFTSGCTNRLQWLDDKLGQGFEKLKEAQLQDVFNLPYNKESKTSDSYDISTSTLVEVARNLTGEQKKEIDTWLTKNNFNRYGDSVDMMYTGGTPLFNETTGESIERFQYILLKHPEILNIIK